MNIFKKFKDAYTLIFKYIGDTFSGWTWRRAAPEIAGAFLDTLKDIFSPRIGRELLTIAAIACMLPLGSILYPIYRLRLHRARIGTCTAHTEPLLTDERLALFKKTLQSLPAKAGQACTAALKRAPKLGLQGAGLALVATGTTVTGYNAMRMFSDPVILNYAELNACNDARARNMRCTPAGQAEKDKQTRIMQNLLPAMGGLAGGFGGVLMLSFSAGANRRPKAPGDTPTPDTAATAPAAPPAPAAA